MTQAEYDALEKEHEYLIHVEAPQVIADLNLARSQGDLSENADYDAARDHQARVAARISEIENILHNSVITATQLAMRLVSAARFASKTFSAIAKKWFVSWETLAPILLGKLSAFLTNPL